MTNQSTLHRSRPWAGRDIEDTATGRQEEAVMNRYHCEVWAGNAAAPHTWLLRREQAPDPETAVHLLRAQAHWLADRLDSDPHDLREKPAAPLREWAEDITALMDLQDRIARGKYVAQATRALGPGALYVLTAMPSAGCPCQSPANPGLLELKGTRLLNASRVLASGGGV
ncbi:hypothetical protein [Streptomyces roseolus]